MNRLFVNNIRATVRKSPFYGDWIARCPCMIFPIHRHRWHEAVAALLKHMKEVHL